MFVPLFSKSLISLVPLIPLVVFGFLFSSTGGWRKVRRAAEYCGLSERTVRKLLKEGLAHSRLPSGTILISLRRLDEYLEALEVKENAIDQLVDDVLGGGA
jgi:hypothetical protein